MSKVNLLLAQAHQSVSSGNFFLATKLLKEVLQEEPENPWAYLVQARVFLKKKDTDEARRCLFTALRFDPGNAHAFYLLARSDYDSHDHPGANGWITKALENDPGNAEYLGFKSLIQLAGFENITEARSLSANGLKNEPDNITCLIASYYTASKAGNRDAANTYIRIAVQKYPDDPDLHALLAGILMQEGKRKAAYDSIMTSLRQAPGSDYYQQRLKEVLSSGNAIISAGRNFITSGWFEKTIKLLMPLAGISWMAGIIHGWLCMIISLGFFILVAFYPASGFELITGFLLLSLIIFHGIRYRWRFNEKYDLTKTLSANEQ